MTLPQPPSAAPRIAIGNRIRRSPYFEATLRWGAREFSVYNHTYMPARFDSPEADYWNLVNGVTLWDVAGQRQLEVSGPDARRFVQWLTPRNLSGCAVGQCRYVVLCNASGGVINDPVLLKLAEDRYWLSLADSDCLLWAQGLSVSAGMDVEIAEADVAPLQIQGPRSPEVIGRLFGDSVTGLGWFRFRTLQLDGIELVVSRTGWSGEPGYELFPRDPHRGDALWERIMAAGRPAGIRPGAPNQARRIEAGMLSLRADMWLDENPFELNLGRLVDLDAGFDFVGREALRHVRERGISRRLVGLELDGAPPQAPAPGRWPVTVAGSGAGHVTSCAYSPRLGRTIAIAMLTRPHDAAGTRVEVQAPDGACPARVAPLPFVQSRRSAAG